MAKPTDIKGKIRHLLALAESPNENEARAALLKARELMARHKLTEAELGEAERQAVRNTLTDITCSKRRDPWICGLSAVIGESYCCKGYRTHTKGRQTQTIGFIGLEDDVEICVAIFKYAVDCIRAGVKAVEKECAGYYPWYVRQQRDSYGYGFARGIQTALARQDEEKRDEWGLVLVMPKEVQEASRHLGKEDFKARTEDTIDHRSYSQGYAEGKEFDPSRRLPGEAAECV